MTVKHQVGHTLGPVGRSIRLLLGLLILFTVITDLITSGHSHTLSTVLLFVSSFIGLVLLYSATYLFLAPTITGRSAWWATIVFVFPTMFLIIAPAINPELQIGTLVGYSVLDHPFMLALLAYLGISFLIQWWDRYGGCEVIAIPNLVFRKSCASYCVPLLPIDMAERKIKKRLSRDT